MRLIRSCIGVVGAFTLCLAAAGCDYPMDVEGTTQHVLESKTLRSGLVSGTDDEAGARDAANRVAKRADARATFEEGTAETLMRDLEHGELDIVVGDFAKNSPWTKHATLTSSPTAKNPPKEKPVIRGALRHGENRWYMFVEKAFKGGAA